MEFIRRLKIPLALLVCFCISPFWLWVGLEDYQNNSTLDRYAIETTGEVIGKPRRSIYYKFTPKTAHSIIGSKGFLDTELIWKVDPTRTPSTHYSSNRLPYLKRRSLYRGDEVTVEYALHKGKFVSRIHNPFIPVLAIMMMLVGVVFFIMPFWMLYTKFSSYKHRMN